MLIRVFLHAEFISAMKTVEQWKNSYTDFQKKSVNMKNAKEMEKWIILVICSQFFEIFTETLETEYQKKSVNMFFRWKRRQIKIN